ncbi:acyl-CoA carboxylase subunit epsilon [Streptomyces sp. NPDC048172]|uniref:acyl-CoA carboxylase subunit epsilon n=1 Tax=Streptomyces sp. NPDC048172 TaxID=3365505 RepID=UPI00371C0B5D
MTGAGPSRLRVPFRLRVVRGNPTAEEVAVLAAVLTASLTTSPHARRRSVSARAPWKQWMCSYTAPGTWESDRF